MPTIRYPAIISKSYLFKLAIPIFFSNLAIPLTGLVDTALMGHLENEKYLVAVSISTVVMTMVLWSFGFLRMGTVGLVAQALGRGDYREIVSTTSRNFILAIIIGIIIIFCQKFIINLIIYFYKPQTLTSSLINDYISIRVFSAPAELIMYILVGFYLGIQRTKISSLLIIIFSLLNIFLSLYLVLNQGLKINGVAFGTVLSAYLTIIAFSTYTYFFIIKNFKLIPNLKKIILKKKLIKLFHINFDIFIRTILLTFSFLWISYQGSILGEDYLAANAILLQFIMVSSFFLDAYAYSIEGVVGFSLGRKVKKSFLLAVRNSFELSFITGLLIALLYTFYYRSIINVITDLEFLRFFSYEYVFWVILIPPVASFCYQFDGIFIGASQSKDMRNAMIISFVIYIFLSIFLVKHLNNHGLWLSLLIFMILRSITLRFFFTRILKRF